MQTAAMSSLALPARSVSAKRSGVAGAPLRASRTVVRAARPAAMSVVAEKTFDSNWLRKDPTVLAISFLGWTVPSSIGVSGFGGNSLFGLLNASIGEELAKFPVGPALDDKFWLYLITWHTGLFLTMLLGQIGVQGRKTGYW